MRRRELLHRLGQVSGLIASGGLVSSCTSSTSTAATSLNRTPSQNEGPFYPVQKPKDLDRNLLRQGDSESVAAGEPLQLTGRVIDTAGQPIAGATIEIWQADNSGIYNHPRAPRRAAFDANFQGYGETRTDADGRYQFLTIVPVPYTGRPPHIHVKVKTTGIETLTTQLYIKGHPDNDRDGILSRLMFRNKDALMMNLRPAEPTSAQAGKATDFDFVV